MAPAGLSESQRTALLWLLDDILTTPGIDLETERRAKWLKMHVAGEDPLARIDRMLLVA